jgi:intraflagellar transport protein 88
MHCFEDSFRYFPSNYDNLIVLGFLYFKDEIYEKAIHFFELATKVQPHSVRIFLIIFQSPEAEIQYAKCFYKLGNYKDAFKAFKKIHNKFPENKEALTFLIATCKDLGLSYEEFNQKLIKLEREVSIYIMYL